MIAKRSSVPQAERLERLHACIEEMSRAMYEASTAQRLGVAEILVEQARNVRALAGYFTRTGGSLQGLRSNPFRMSFDGFPLPMKLDIARTAASETLARLEERRAVSAECGRQIRDVLDRPGSDPGTVVAVAAVLPDLQKRLVDLGNLDPPLPNRLELANGLMAAATWLTDVAGDPGS